MLQGGAYLQLKGNVAERPFLQSADVVQGVVSEAVQLVQFPLVDRFLPVYLKMVLDNGGSLVDIVGIEGDDPQPHEVGHVGQ